MKQWVLLLVVLVPGLSFAQTPAPESAPHMVRAAGMPLNDGALPPGTLTIRIVEGAFTRNLPDQVVELEVSGGITQSATTGADGRAQFAHLPVGSRVRAAATVGGERLESEFFAMPAQSGVRVLLVAGASAGPAGAAAGESPSSPSPAIADPVPVPQPTTPSTDPAVAVIRAVLATITACAFGALLLSRRTRSPRNLNPR